MTTLPAAVEIVEVSPRDGLQAETRVLPTRHKVELVARAVGAGIRRVEVASFARPDLVPQMADADAVIEGVRDLPGLRPIALVLNERGFDRALAAGIPEINVVVLVTETFSRRNQGIGVAEAVAAWSSIARRAEAAGIRRGVTLSAAFGCPFEGEVAPAAVLELVDRVLAIGADEISLADTIGVGVPTQVEALVGEVLARGGPPVRCHLHDTRNTGVANAVAAVAAGATAIDASIGGVGGCPFAPRAAGNTATEDLVYVFERMGVRTGIDLEAVIAAASWLDGHLDSTVGGAVTRSGGFPRQATEDPVR